jgi:ligand-binding SRPBCC domain-containing protein
MKSILVTTRVKAGLPEVVAAFNKDLFLRLNPPFPPVRLLRYDGNESGNRVELELNFLLFKQRWVSVISETAAGPHFWWFKDEGEQLPFFLKSWSHKHVIEQKDGFCLITDAIELTAPAYLPHGLVAAAIRLLMLYRRPVYRKIFGAV